MFFICLRNRRVSGSIRVPMSGFGIGVSAIGTGRSSLRPVRIASYNADPSCVVSYISCHLPASERTISGGHAALEVAAARGGVVGRGLGAGAGGTGDEAGADAGRREGLCVGQGRGAAGKEEGHPLPFLNSHGKGSGWVGSKGGGGQVEGPRHDRTPFETDRSALSLGGGFVPNASGRDCGGMAGEVADAGGSVGAGVKVGRGVTTAHRPRSGIGGRIVGEIYSVDGGGSGLSGAQKRIRHPSLVPSTRASPFTAVRTDYSCNPSSHKTARFALQSRAGARPWKWRRRTCCLGPARVERRLRQPVPRGAV